jgi:hypothetical protein
MKLVSVNGTWKLIVGGQPFFIKGVVGNTYLEKVKAYGGNSVRIGSRKEELDKVIQLGLNAQVNLSASSERNGFNYNVQTWTCWASTATEMYRPFCLQKTFRGRGTTWTKVRSIIFLQKKT